MHRLLQAGVLLPEGVLSVVGSRQLLTPTLRFTSMDPCFSASGVNPSGTEPASPSTQER